MQPRTPRQLARAFLAWRLKGADLMDQAEWIELEMRLSALEFMFCRLSLTFLIQSGLSNEQINRALQEFLKGAPDQKFRDADPAMHDLLSAEWTQAIERLVNAQKDMLAQRRPEER